MEIERRLYEAAVEGDASALKLLVKEDPLLLDRISLTFFHESPLHVATLRGHAKFAREVLSLNPRLATEVDSLGQTPLHLASAQGHVEIVRELLQVGPINTCLARTKDGMIPLHLAIMNGDRVEVVKELTRACPESTRLKVDRGDTALHLCVKHHNLDVLQVLVEELMVMDEIENDATSLLNARNDDGNTILHLAALHKNLEIIRYLLAKPGIELNVVNNNGFTVLDVIENSPRDIKGLEALNVLLQANAQRATTDNSVPLSPKKAHVSPRNSNAKSKAWKRFFTFNDNSYLESFRNELTITAAIIAAVIALPMINMNLNKPDISLTDDYPSYTLAFAPAIAVIVLLVSGFSLQNNLSVWLVVQLMYTVLGFFGLNFIGRMISVESRNLDTTSIVVMIIWFVLLLIVSLLNLIRLIVWIVKVVKGRAKKSRLSSEERNQPLSSA